MKSIPWGNSELKQMGDAHPIHEYHQTLRHFGMQGEYDANFLG
jgi:hypothetical protein